MSAARWERVSEVFAGALERSQEDRAGWLAQACGGDRELEVEVERLLASHRAAGAFLERPALGAALDLDLAAPDASGADHVEGYRILRQVGEGGFGRVYEAQQERPVRRRVALKVLKPGMDSARVLARFAAEQQALARMEHPAIAVVLDAGATREGRPYFAMEFVDGAPITAFCAARGLPLRARLELFAEVCGAVQHAHQKGILHRDLKPSNVLVADRPGDARLPKVIDFGVAKALEGEGEEGEATLLTQQGELVGTPTYMSPEQAAGDPRGVDTRSDVYALGALLYELACGAPPFDPARLRRAGATEIQRILREEEPPRPSVRAPAPRARELRGELDWIAMKALEKDRERRYASASELAADVERHLRGDTVLAGPPSRRYRLGKLARRYRVALTAAGLVFVALALGLAGTLWKAAESDRNAAESERRNQSLLAALQIWNEVLGAAAPARAQGREMTVVDALDELEQKLAGFEGPPEVEAEIRGMLGRGFLSLARSAQARPHLERSFELRRQAFGAEDPETLRALNDLARALAEGGDVERAAELFARSYEACLRVLGPAHLRTLTALNNRAQALQQLGRFDEALPLLQEALERQRAQHGDEHPFTLVHRHNLATLLTRMGRVEEAEAALAVVLEARRRALGDRHPETLETLAHVGLARLRLGRVGEAVEALEQAHALMREVLGEESPLTRDVAQNLEAARSMLAAQ